MIIIDLLILTLVALLVIAGVRLNLFLRKHGVLDRDQQDKHKGNEQKPIKRVRDCTIKQEVKAIQAKFHDLFGPYAIATATCGYPVIVTVYIATSSEEPIHYSRYFKIFDNYEEWQPDDLYADAFHPSENVVPQSVKDRLNTMIQEAETHARASRRLQW